MLELKKGMIIKFDKLGRNMHWYNVLGQVISVDGDGLVLVKALSSPAVGDFEVGDVGTLYGPRTDSASLVPLDNI